MGADSVVRTGTEKKTAKFVFLYGNALVRI